jgi:hypothetical protein
VPWDGSQVDMYLETTYNGRFSLGIISHSPSRSH